MILRVLKHKQKPEQVVGIAQEAEVDIKKDLNIDVSSKPSLYILKLTNQLMVKTLL